jgi:hypothetical protein
MTNLERLERLEKSADETDYNTYNYSISDHRVYDMFNNPNVFLLENTFDDLKWEWELNEEP